MSDISVVIVTRDRFNDLNECIISLLSQSKKIDELVIVDNNSSDSTKKLIQKFSKSSKVNIKYICEKKIGYPYVRNRGLKEASGDWVAFIDDDCIADKDWYKQVVISIKRNKNVTAILGFSRTFYINNIFSFTVFVLNEFWKKNQIKGENIFDLEILDSKNIIFNKIFLHKKSIYFDESRAMLFNGACEDSDLGMQIQKLEGKAIFNKKIIVDHKDPISFLGFYKKLIFSTRSYDLYHVKWKIFRKRLNLKRKYKILPFSIFILKNYKKNFLFSLFFFTNLVLAILTVRFIKFYINIYNYFLIKKERI